MKPDISEFSYGYALTSEIVQLYGASLVGAPVFPSLIDEGSLGYDLELPVAGKPIFFQFKLSDHMVRSTAQGANKMPVPHYRMHLRPLKHSRQHDLLLALEKRGHIVFYAAPQFHRPDELNDAYAMREVVQRSAFFRPNAIGSLPDQHEHFVCFNGSLPHGYLCSEPVAVDRVHPEVALKTLTDDIVDPSIAQLPARVYLERLAKELVEEWADTLSDITRPDVDWLVSVEDARGAVHERMRLLGEVRQTKGLLEYLGWVSQSLFDAFLFLRLRRKDVT